MLMPILSMFGRKDKRSMASSLNIYAFNCFYVANTFFFNNL